MTRADRLIEILENMIENYSELDELAREKNEILGRQKLEALEAITEAEEELVVELNSLKEERIEVWEEITGWAREELRYKTIKELLSVLPKETALKINKLRKELKQITRDLQRVNQENILFHKNRLEVYDRTFKNFVSQINSEEPGTYDREGQSGEAESKSKPSVLIDRAV